MNERLEFAKTFYPRHARLLAQAVGLDPALLDKVRFTGGDPVVNSKFHLGGASAIAVAVHSAAIAQIWKMRSCEEQTVCVDATRAAMPGLRTMHHIKQNGYPLAVFPKSSFGSADFFRTKDGRDFYIMRTTLYVDNILGVIELLKCSFDIQSMAEAVARWNSWDLEEAFAERKLIGIVVRRREEWLEHPQGRILASLPPVKVEKIGDSDPELLVSASRPLSGVRVFDFTHVIAGPTTSRMLAEQGADVLRVTSPHRWESPFLGMDTGSGKRWAHLDLDQLQDRNVAQSLASETDIFVQSWRTGCLAKHGLSPKHLAEKRPGIIYVSISAYGSEGSWAERVGYETVGQTVSGLAFEEGQPAAPRFSPIVNINDYLTAYLAAAGTSAALIRRATEGGSYHVQASLTRTSMWVQELGKLPKESRLGKDVELVARAQDFFESEGPYGRLSLARPIAEFSHSRAYWDGPPPAPGSSSAGWRHGSAAGNRWSA